MPAFASSPIGEGNGNAAGIECLRARGEGCCGAIKHHLGDGDGGLAQMRANVDAWWPHIERGEVSARAAARLLGITHTTFKTWVTAYR